MMTRAVAASPVALPLLVWNEQQEINRLQRQRAALIARIAVLKPLCHRRVELEFRLRVLTSRQLELTSTIARADR